MWHTEHTRSGCPGVVYACYIALSTNPQSIQQLHHVTNKKYGCVFSTGTEVNNELCTHVPGPACDETSGNQMGGPVEGFIHVHRGIRGVGDLSADDYAWINPVAAIFISEPTYES